MVRTIFPNNQINKANKRRLVIDVTAFIGDESLNLRLIYSTCRYQPKSIVSLSKNSRATPGSATTFKA